MAWWWSGGGWWSGRSVGENVLMRWSYLESKWIATSRIGTSNLRGRSADCLRDESLEIRLYSRGLSYSNGPEAIDSKGGGPASGEEVRRRQVDAAARW